MGRLTDVNKRHGDKTEIYCAAFDNAEAGQLRASADAFNGITKVNFNWCATGTYTSLNNFLNNQSYSNGLVTRLSIATIPDMFAEPISAIQMDSFTDLEKFI